MISIVVKGIVLVIVLSIQLTAGVLITLRRIVSLSVSVPLQILSAHVAGSNYDGAVGDHLRASSYQWLHGTQRAYRALFLRSFHKPERIGFIPLRMRSVVLGILVIVLPVAFANFLFACWMGIPGWVITALTISLYVVGLVASISPSAFITLISAPATFLVVTLGFVIWVTYLTYVIIARSWCLARSALNPSESDEVTDIDLEHATGWYSQLISSLIELLRRPKVVAAERNARLFALHPRVVIVFFLLIAALAPMFHRELESSSLSPLPFSKPSLLQSVWSLPTAWPGPYCK